MNDQTASRSAVAAASRRSLTAASSRAARSMRSCCLCARSCWWSARLCWLSVRACWSSARSVTALSCSAIASTVRVSSANWPATLAMSSRVVTFCPILKRRELALKWRRPRRSILARWLQSWPRGRSSVGRALASQARCRGFESHRPLREIKRNMRGIAGFVLTARDRISPRWNPLESAPPRRRLAHNWPSGTVSSNEIPAVVSARPHVKQDCPDDAGGTVVLPRSR